MLGTEHIIVATLNWGQRHFNDPQAFNLIFIKASMAKLSSGKYLRCFLMMNLHFLIRKVGCFDGARDANGHKQTR